MRGAMVGKRSHPFRASARACPTGGRIPWVTVAISQRTPPRPNQKEREDGERPALLIVVATWDMLLAVFALLDALAVLAGHREVNGRTVDIPVAVQIFQALAYAALAVAVFLIGTLLITRRSRWVRRAQIIVLIMAVVLASVSLTVTLVTDQSARDLATVLVSALVVLLDLLVIAVMTAPRIRAWFAESGEVPLYLGGLIAFWAAASAAFFVLGLSTG